MKELVDFSVETAGRKSPEFINKTMYTAKPDCTLKFYFGILRFIRPCSLLR